MNDFRWKHFRGEIIWGCVRWYCKYGISYRDLEEMMVERGGVRLTTPLCFAGSNSSMPLRSKNVYDGTINLAQEKVGKSMKPM